MIRQLAIVSLILLTAVGAFAQCQNLIANLPTPSWAYGIDVQGRYAYVAVASEGMVVIDILNPALPSQVGHVDANSISEGVTVNGNYAYLAAGGEGLRVINISNPANPDEVGFYNTAGGARAVAVQGNYAYVADNQNGLVVVNITNPANPAYVGGVDTPEFAVEVDVEGDYAYVADTGGGLRIINISNPTNPVEVGNLPTPGWAYDVTVVDEMAFVASNDRGVRIIDVSTPSSPVEINAFFDGQAATQGVAYDGRYIFAAERQYGFQVIEATDVLDLVEEGTVDTDNVAFKVALGDDGLYAYVTDREGGLNVFDISACDIIFANGFESGDTSRWSSVEQ